MRENRVDKTAVRFAQPNGGVASPDSRQAHLGTHPHSSTMRVRSGADLPLSGPPHG